MHHHPRHNNMSVDNDDMVSFASFNQSKLMSQVDEGPKYDHGKFHNTFACGSMIVFVIYAYIYFRCRMASRKRGLSIKARNQLIEEQKKKELRDGTTSLTPTTDQSMFEKDSTSTSDSTQTNSWDPSKTSQVIVTQPTSTTIDFNNNK